MSNMNFQRGKVIVPAGSPGNPGTVSTYLPGNLFFCQFSTQLFSMQLDVDGPIPMSGGIVTPAVLVPFRKQTFFNSAAYPILVVFYVAGAGFQFFPSPLNPPTYPVGQVQTLNAGNGYIGAAIPGVNTGNLRKQIVFTLVSGDAGTVPPSSGGHAPDPILNICDVNGNPLMPLTQGIPLTFDSSGTYYLRGINCHMDNVVEIGELYYDVQ
jgi:hypothetical protein